MAKALPKDGQLISLELDRDMQKLRQEEYRTRGFDQIKLKFV
jgi:predicted O-methyltransferase YrrM